MPTDDASSLPALEKKGILSLVMLGMAVDARVSTAYNIHHCYQLQTLSIHRVVLMNCMLQTQVISFHTNIPICTSSLTHVHVKHACKLLFQQWNIVGVRGSL